jgi:hypothetical protein
LQCNNKELDEESEIEEYYIKNISENFVPKAKIVLIAFAILLSIIAYIFSEMIAQKPITGF